MTTQTISVAEFNQRFRLAMENSNLAVKSHPIMHEDVQPIVRDYEQFKEAANIVGDAITYASTSPTATDVVRMMLYLITSYPITPFHKSVASGMFATDGIRVFINPAAVKACNRDELIAIMMHELGHIMLDDSSGYKNLMRVIDNSVTATEDAYVPTVVTKFSNLFIDPCVNRLAIDAANQCGAIDSKFVTDHYDMCVAEIQMLLDIALSTGAYCDDPQHQQTFNTGADFMYRELSKQAVVSVDPNTAKLGDDKWDLLYSFAKLISRSITPQDDDDLRSPSAGPGDVTDDPNVTIRDVSSKRKAAMDNAVKSAGSSPGQWGLTIPKPKPSNKLDDYLPFIIQQILSGDDTYATIDPVVASMGSSMPAKDISPATVGVALDVSGSVVYSPDEMSVLLGELVNALNTPLIAKILLVLFDHGTIRDENIIILNTGDPIEPALEHVTGGGGTEFNTPVEKLLELSEKGTEFTDDLGMIVMLTDGEARFDASRFDDDIPRVWISTHTPTDSLDPEQHHVLLDGRQGIGQ